MVSIHSRSIFPLFPLELLLLEVTLFLLQQPRMPRISPRFVLHTDLGQHHYIANPWSCHGSGEMDQYKAFFVELQDYLLVILFPLLDSVLEKVSF